ncbi:MAG: glycosyltransferase family 2 protein [Armatimonadota bacterium]
MPALLAARKKVGEHALAARRRIAVIMPAYNAAATLEKTYRDLPERWADDVILVDDASIDGTADIARRLGLHVIVHPRNRGYGGNQKTCYQAALRRGADIVVMLHPDYQYDPRRVAALVEPILSDRADVVLGSRLADGRALANGMPLYKYVANRFLTALENLVFRTNHTELHTGLRAYQRRVLETIPFEQNSDDFVFDSQVIAQVRHFGFRLAEIPVSARYMPEASSIGLKRSMVYGLQTLLTLARYCLHRWHLKRSPLFAAEGPKKAPAAAGDVAA